MILNFALNYGGRTEIVTAAKTLAEKVKDGSLNIEDIDESLFSNYLMTESLQDPELLIRTSGEIRLSNFMLWQVATVNLSLLTSCGLTLKKITSYRR